VTNLDDELVETLAVIDMYESESGESFEAFASVSPSLRTLSSSSCGYVACHLPSTSFINNKIS